MLKIWRFCAVLFTTLLFGFSANAAIDCSNSEPDFFATIELEEAAKFEFKISAGGNFCIDWGDDSDIEAIEDKGTTNTAYSHTYSAAGTYTIGISGGATKYNTGTTTPAITFGYNSTYRKLITSISGSLGAIFPTLSDGSQPRFYQTFYNCSNLTGTLTNDLFDGIYGTTVSNMFRQTFAGCSSLTQELPDALFAGLTGTPAQDSFKNTFTKTNITGNVYASMFGELDIVNGAEEMDGIFNSVDTLETTCPDGSDSIENSLGVTLCSATESTTPTCDDGYWLNGDTCEICPAGSYCANNIKTECDAGYTTDETGATDISRCYTTCERECTPQSCPENSTCVLDETVVSSGTQYYGGTCNAVAQTCPITTITCNDGYAQVGDTCVLEPEFTITTTNMSANTKFQFTISASGTFYVDCGDGGTLSGTGVSGNTITRNNTTNAQYTCTYPKSGTHTIKMYGDATGYTKSSGIAAISFSGNTNIKTVDGSLGAIFSGSAPYMFQFTFFNCTSLTSIPENLFAGVSGSAEYMFNQTFALCSGLTGTIPEKLFSGVSGSADRMFSGTFYGCKSLTSIPENLFSGVSGSAKYMFGSTFSGCSGLTGTIPENLFSGVSGSAESMFDCTFSGCSGLTGTIPENLFSGVSGSAEYMFYYTFNGCKSLTSIPENLFNGVSGSANGMFNYTFGGCSGLTGTIPENLFSGVSGSAEYMFGYTFYGCSGLTGTIPENLFSGVSGSADYMFNNTFYGCSGLTGTIPEKLFRGVSGSANGMFRGTFYGCKSLTSIPENLFAGVSGSAEYMFSQTFNNCTSLTNLPDGLFKNIEGKPAEDMFNSTFSDCTKLSGYIPANTFEKMDSTDFNSATMSNIFNNTALATTCPAGTIRYITDFESAWNGHVACTPCPESHPNSDAGATDISQCYTTCERECTPPTCPENATCAYDSESATGTQNWGGTCSATAPTCSVTITCNTGYWLNGDTCEICPAGSSCENNIKTECESGTYTDTTGQTSCAICPVGSYCAGGIKLECVAGTYTDTTRQSECAICPIGSYCVGGIRRTCPDGQFTDTTQRTTCTICPIGSACSNGIHTECPDGQYTNATGQTVCTSCPMGSYCTAGIVNQCVGGTYSDAPGMSVCATCPDGTTSIPGAISANQCGNTKVLHIGDTATMNLFTVRPEQKPYMVFDINGVQYYGEMSTTQTGITDGSDVKFKILHNDTEYYLHDFSAK